MTNQASNFKSRVAVFSTLLIFVSTISLFGMSLFFNTAAIIILFVLAGAIIMAFAIFVYIFLFLKSLYPDNPNEKIYFKQKRSKNSSFKKTFLS